MNLGERINRSRHVHFIGREEELAIFSDALRSERLPFHVLHVHGQGGSGKTTLLREFERHCADVGIDALYLDAHFLSAAPDAFRQAVGRLFPSSDSPRRVLIVDTYEAIESLDGWLRRSFLPDVDDNLLVVLAGRIRPDSSWLADPGWREAIRVLPLRNLSPEEAEDFLHAREVPQEQHPAVLAFTYGHPLALALAAEHVRIDPSTPFSLDGAPDVVQMLLKRFVMEAPDKAHRTALEAASLVRALTEPLLSALLNTDDVHDAFTWLRRLTFMQEGPRGILPHDLARDVLIADLQWRDPKTFNELHERARTLYMAQLRDATTDDERREVISSYVFLYRTNPIVRPILGILRDKWEKVGRRMVGTLETSDLEALRAMIAAHEGRQSADLADYWFKRSPEWVQVFRDADDKAAGFLLTIDLEATSEAERSADPALNAAWRFLQANAPLRAGERAIVFRHWMDEEGYQGISATQSLVFSTMVRRYLTTPRLAFSFLPCAEEEFWSTIFALARIGRIEGADYAVEGRKYAVFGHDWRAEPVEMWMERLAEQAPYVVPGPNEPALAPALLVLSKPDFQNAVQDALRNYMRAHEMQNNPLLRSRLVEERAGSDADVASRIAVLSELIDEAANAIRDAPRDEQYYRALRATFLKPAPTQAMAAERLGVPFSTYRRHLKRGVEHVADALWRLETA